MSYERTPAIREAARQRGLGRKHTKKTRLKLSKSAKKRTKRTGWHHSPETRAKLRQAGLGNKRALGSRSRTGRAKQAVTQAVWEATVRSSGHVRHATLNLPMCGCVVHAKKYVSQLSKRMIFLLLREFDVEAEKRFGPYRVDAYLPKEHIAFEADGDYWHFLPGIPERDAKRDAYLLTHYGLPVVRLREAELNVVFHELDISLDS